MKHLVEWDAIEIRVDGARLEAMAREAVAREPVIERLSLRFANGLLRVEGSLRKFVSIPFSIDVTRLEARGLNVRVPLARIAAGPFPLPTILAGLVKDRLPRTFATFEEPATFVISLAPFMPPFVAAEIREVWIIEGGLAVTLGSGGADPPAGGFDGRQPG